MRALANEPGCVGAIPYDTEFEVYADGYLFRLVDPYSVPKLYIKRPGAHDQGVCYGVRVCSTASMMTVSRHRDACIR